MKRIMPVILALLLTACSSYQGAGVSGSGGSSGASIGIGTGISF